MRALELHEAGWKQCDIAEALDVDKSAVSHWQGRAARGGQAALEARSRPGAPAKLSAAALSRVPEFLSYGAEAYGFRGEVWTSRRVTKVIEWEYGVTYNHRYVASLLKQLRWTPQKPIERASQRDEAAITVWRASVWEDLKKRLLPKGARLCLWMKPAFTCCRPLFARMRRAGARRWCVSFKRAITCRP